MADTPLSAQQIRSDLTTISRQSGMGDIYSAMQNMCYGINHRGTGNPVPNNLEHYGLTFFTRPLMNLTYHNLLSERRLQPYLTDDRYSLNRMIRAYLDPWSNMGRYMDVGKNLPQEREEVIDSPLVDPNSPFINLLTNSLISLNGWPDDTMDTYTSTEGLMKEAFSIPDAPEKLMGVYDLTANFRNMAGDPITLLFHLWITYTKLVRLGKLQPYPEMLVRQEKDWETRIFRLTLDPTRTYVQKISSAVAGFPTANPWGASANFNSDKPVSEENSQISIPFRMHGIEYGDPVLIYEFNKIVSIFDPYMRTEADNLHSLRTNLDADDTIIEGVKQGVYAKIDTTQLNPMNFRGRPRINPLTMELEWYARVDEFLK